jgi:hypothetical protein|tara:strand:- start:217 stop:510 length:294 start_codon:yes stop_codon:yes gene_type:complete
MSIKIVDLNKRKGKPTIDEVVDKCDSLMYQFELRGEPRLNTALTLMSYTFSEILRLTRNEDITIQYVNEVLNTYVTNEDTVSFTPDFDINLDPENKT